ncbi:glycan metabolism protein RagB [Niastella yeongjuensis]|uniref:Glycan metabolism protein RagB n=1 Tax=Niastella yeongjuensis TaxID=354355 RepID=A0A1V9E1M7_9BACT|nr:RagB/SusD family nutrient uptake outer membrane protein [Niastella yeongjuensis]OQP40033.1 glycan metabolism protein RagB [Niastella yeongjuensis]SEO14246.1 Starch-binding associating with outer membrane [Niastella yeongjuensis]
MKKILYNISIVVLSGVMLTSCKKFLDRRSEASFDSESTFQDASRAEMVVLGIYSLSFNRELYYQFGMGTDECISTEGETNSKNMFANYVYSPDITPTDTYAAMYKAIEYANICIKNLPGITPADDKDQKKLNMLLGEAYALRAMCYMNVVRYFGDVPYPTIPVQDAGTYTSSRVSRDTIYDGCVADLQKAVQLLPWKSEGMVPTIERFTKNAAYGILARTALYAAGYSLRWDLNTFAASSIKLAQRSDAARVRELYQIASDACNAVMQKGENSLLTSYETVFRDLVNGRYNNESMLEFGQYGPDVNGSAIGYTNGMFSHTSSLFGKAQPAMGVMPTFYFDFEDGDTRRDVSITNYGITDKSARQLNSYGANTIGKFRVTWKTTAGTGINLRDINWPWLRYSDVLLMYAEAQNELNSAPTPTAIAAYEQVRKRGFGGNATKIGVTPVTYQDFKNAVINERKLELSFEGWRRTDLVRWGIQFETLTQTKQNLIDMTNHTGKYANIDLYRTYKLETATGFNDPVVAVPFTGFKAKLNTTDSATAKSNGLTILDMYSATAISGGQVLGATQAWVKAIFRGLEKNKTELLPLNTTTINNNPGLAGQQHPLY